MGGIRNITIKLVIAVAVILMFCSISAYAATYKFVPLKENVANVGQLSAKSTSSFKVYKVVIIRDKLRITKRASLKSNSIGVYRLGNIVEIKGKSGSFLKTSLGYIKESDTKKVNGMYVKAAKALKLINPSSLKSDSRLVQAGNVYKIVGSKGGYLKIKVGRMNGYIPMSIIGSVNDTNNTKITIGWDMIGSKSGNESLLSKSNAYVNIRSKTTGLDVISPTWFDISGSATSPTAIDIIDIADRKYVDVAHGNGYEIWARFCEMDKARAAAIFNDTALRTKIIDKIVKLAVQYDIDGINVDFEALGIANKDGFTRFMKELYPKLKKYNMNVSVDITKIAPTSTLYSMCYDRPALAKYADYLMLMAYDEYYSTSTEAGSVGSYNWVESAVADILKQGVPASKLIMGAPFYLRDFSVVPYDFVLAKANTKIYSSSNTTPPVMLGTVKKYDKFKYMGYYSNWYIINYNGKNGYVLKNDSEFFKANTIVTTPGAINTTTGGVSVTTGTAIDTVQGGAIDFVITEDTVVMNKDVAVYSAASEGLASVLGATGTKDYLKYVGQEKDCYIVSYNGSKGYIRTSQSSFYKADTRAVASGAVSMQTAIDRIRDNNGEIHYDSDARQQVGVYNKDGIKHYIWLETVDSMKWRMEFVNKYKLPGAAFWSMYWKTTAGIWDVIKTTLKK